MTDEKSIHQLFKQAIHLINHSPYKNNSLDSQLKASEATEYILYGLYKQITSKGVFPTSPKNNSTHEYNKWESWKSYRHLDKKECQLLYLSLIYPVLNQWTSEPIQKIETFLYPHIISDRNEISSLISKIKDLQFSLEYKSEIMTRVSKLSRLDYGLEEDFGDNSSEFSFEELVDYEERPSLGRIDSISTISGFTHLSGTNNDTHLSSSTNENIVASPKSEKPNTDRRMSISSMHSVELLPTVPYTPSFGPSHRQARKLSNASITPLSLTSPPKQSPSRSRSNSNAQNSSTKSSCSPSRKEKTNLSPNENARRNRSRTCTGPPPPAGLRDETSALIQSTSQRLGQGMVLVRRSLQRLQKLEEKVDGVLHKKLTSPALSPIVLSPNTHHLPFNPPELQGEPLEAKDTTITSWFSKVYNSLL